MSEICSAVGETKIESPKMKPKWVAVYTATHHESRVHSLLAERGVESFLPVYTARRQWKKRPPVAVQFPLFPNYVFVRIAERRSVILGTPGVFSIVGSGKNAWELPDKEIETLRIGIRERKVEPHPYLNLGERARVVSGVLAGLEGIVVRKKNNLQMVLSLDQIMRSVAIAVDARELEPVRQGPAQQLSSLEQQVYRSHSRAGCGFVPLTASPTSHAREF